MQSLLSQLLIKEHNIIEKAEHIIFSHNLYWQSHPIEYEKLINQLTLFFSVYADEYHHRKEEDILFPAVQKKNELLGIGIIPELLEQHKFFREMVHNIQKALEIKDYAAVQLLFETYINALKDHIAIENDELFPMVDTLFSEDELEKLYHSCIDQERELGMTRKATFENLFNKF